MGRPTITTVNAADYSRGFNGTALKCILVRGAFDANGKINPDNIVARCNNVNYGISTPTTQADEINQTGVNETNYGRLEVGTGNIGIVFNLKANDQMPTRRTLRDETDLTMFEVTGDDHPMTSLDAAGNVVKSTILNVFTGVKITNRSSGAAVNQQKMLNITFNYLDMLTGAEWFVANSGGSQYPATVVANPA